MSSISPSRPEMLCLVQSSFFSPTLLFLEGEKHLGCFELLKTEPPLKPSGLAAERCVRRILKERRPSGYADSVSPFLASKNKGIPEKIRAGPHPKPTLLLLLLPPPPSLSLTHTQTHTQKNTQQGKGDFTQPSTRHTSSLVLQPC